MQLVSFFVAFQFVLLLVIVNAAVENDDVYQLAQYEQFKVSELFRKRFNWFCFLDSCNGVFGDDIETAQEEIQRHRRRQTLQTLETNESRHWWTQQRSDNRWFFKFFLPSGQPFSRSGHYSLIPMIQYRNEWRLNRFSGTDGRWMGHDIVWCQCTQRIWRRPRGNQSKVQQ